jgi:NAD(P)-dependent dehydrogenase (short-subunit alcohol dehydrogenase family)
MRTALVTGGGRGIGRAIAGRLAADGLTVGITYRRDADAAEATAAEIGGRAYAADVSSYADNERLVDHVLADLGGVDVLVHNAGIASRGNLVADTDPDEPARLMGTHVFGPFGLTKLLLPQMREHERGDIVFISSVASTQYSPGGAPYTMAKAAMEALARTLAAEEVGNGIHVNMVAPGLTVSEMGDRLAKAITGESAADLDRNATFGRVARPEDVADVVAYLVSAPLLTAQRVEVQAGSNPFVR